MKQLILYFLMFPIAVTAQQNNKIDSLKKVLLTASDDTNKVNALNELSKEFKSNNPDTAIYFAKNAGLLAEKINYKKGIAESELWQGTAITNLGKYEEALQYLHKAIEILISLSNNKLALARAHNGIGNIYTLQGNYPEALKEHFASLKIKEEIGDKKGIAGSHGNIGNIYMYQGNYPEALKELFAVLKTFEEIGDKNFIAMSHNSIGNIYYAQSNYPGVNPLERDSLFNRALKEHFAALKTREEIKDKQGIATSHNNIGAIYYDQGNYPDALREHFASLKIMEEIGNKYGIGSSHKNIGETYIKQGKAKEGKEELEKSLALSKETGSKDGIKESYAGLAKADSALDNYKSAYNNYKLYIIYKDSLLNEENTKKSVRAQMNYDFDKKESLAKAEQEKKDAIVEEEKRRQKMFLFSVIGGLLLVVVFSGFLFNRFRVTQRQKKIIEKQKLLTDEKNKIIEEKNKDITDSINYAQRIQRALLASDGLLNKNLGEHFVLFKPKDIVSGDFYWATESVGSKQLAIGNETTNRFYLAVCDSTGHGVPGLS